MQLYIKKTGQLKGTVTVPASKSHSVRALLFALLASGQSIIDGLLDSDDTNCARAIIQDFGAKIQCNGNHTVVQGFGLPLEVRSSLNSGNSGITTCFALPLVGLNCSSNQPVEFGCAKQMQQRPIGSLLQALTQLGLAIDSIAHKQQLPVRISGKLLGGEVVVSGVSSQYVSALLMALPCAEQDSKIIVNDLQERPYVDLTLVWLNKLGIHYHHDKQERQDIFNIRGNQMYGPFTATITGDFSSASYLIAAACLLPGKVVLKNLDINDAQGDKRLVPILKAMGAEISIAEKTMTILGGKVLQGISIDANDIPDLVPTLAVIATQAEGETPIKNVAHAKIKETDRLVSIYQGLKEMGADIELRNDGLIVKKSVLKGAIVDGYGDHRTVMALAVAGMIAEGQTSITTAESITKTYPDFVKDMQSLQANIEMLGV